MVTEWIGVATVARETGGNLSGAGEEEPQPVSGQVDEGQEVSSTIEEERDEVVERVVAWVDMMMVFYREGDWGENVEWCRVL